MKRFVPLALAACLGAAIPLGAAPSIAKSGVKNGASYVDPGFPNGAIAQGSIFDVFGSGLGPAQIQYASSFPLPTALSGTSVSVTVNGTTVQCYMLFTLASQVAAILPSTTPVGTGTMVVSYNGATSATAPVTVSAHSLGLFTVNQQGNGAGVIQDAAGKPNSASWAFAPNQQVVFWGTGLGPITGSDASQPVQGNLPGITVTANIGGKAAQVAYAGRSLNAGADQINVIIPAGVTGCYVPAYITVAAGGVISSSNMVSIAIAASGTTCTDPSAPSGLISGQGYKFGSIDLSRSSSSISFGGMSINQTTDSGSGVFQSFNASYLTSGANTPFYDQQVGSCIVYQLVAQTGGTPILPIGLDAGPVINVNGPNGAKQLLQDNKTEPGFYDTQAPLGQQTTFPGLPSTPLYLDPGTYTLDNGSGGKDVGPFKLTLVVPPTFTWTNQSSINTVDRTQPLTVTWTGGDPNSLVWVSGSSTSSAGANGMFVCYGKDSDLSLTVPPAILSLLPPSSVQSGSGTGLLNVSTNVTVTGSAPGLDMLTASDSAGAAKIGITYK